METKPKTVTSKTTVPNKNVAVKNETAGIKPKTQTTSNKNTALKTEPLTPNTKAAATKQMNKPAQGAKNVPAVGAIFAPKSVLKPVKPVEIKKEKEALTKKPDPVANTGATAEQKNKPVRNPLATAPNTSVSTEQKSKPVPVNNPAAANTAVSTEQKSKPVNNPAAANTAVSTEQKNKPENNLPVKKSEESDPAAVAPDAKDVKMAIVKDGYPECKIDKEEFNVIQREILKKIDSTPIECPLPKLHGSEVCSGIFNVICADAATVRWLVLNFNDSKDTLNNATLKVYTKDKIPKSIRVSFKTSDVFTDDAATFLTRLERYNPDLKCKNWTVLKKDVQEKAIIWLFQINQTDLDAIKKAKYEAHSGIDRGTFKVFSTGEGNTATKVVKPPAGPAKPQPSPGAPKNQGAPKPAPGGAAKNQNAGGQAKKTNTSPGGPPRNQNFKVPAGRPLPRNQGRPLGKLGDSRNPAGRNVKAPNNNSRQSGPQSRDKRDGPLKKRQRTSRWDEPDGGRGRDDRRSESRGSLLPPPRKKQFQRGKNQRDGWQGGIPSGNMCYIGGNQVEPQPNLIYTNEMMVASGPGFTVTMPQEDPYEDYELQGQDQRNRGRSFQNFGNNQGPEYEDSFIDGPESAGRPSLLGDYAPNSRKRSNQSQMSRQYANQQSIMNSGGNFEVWNNNNMSSALLPNPHFEPVTNDGMNAVRYVDNGNSMFNNPYGNQQRY